MDVPVDRHFARQQAEAGDLREEAEVDVRRVAPGEEQHGMTLVAEVGALLATEDRVEPRLDRSRRHARLDQGDVAAEIGDRRRTCERGPGGERRQPCPSLSRRGRLAGS